MAQPIIQVGSTTIPLPYPSEYTVQGGARAAEFAYLGGGLDRDFRTGLDWKFHLFNLSWQAIEFGDYETIYTAWVLLRNNGGTYTDPASGIHSVTIVPGDAKINVLRYAGAGGVILHDVRLQLRSA